MILLLFVFSQIKNIYPDNFIYFLVFCRICRNIISIKSTFILQGTEFIASSGMTRTWSIREKICRIFFRSFKYFANLPFLTLNSIFINQYRYLTDFRPDGVGTVTQEEKENFTTIKKRLRVLLEHQITNFRFVFPFGRPEGALKSTLTLLEQVKYIFS